MKHLLSLFLLLPMLCMAQPDRTAASKLPSQDELATINDSILQEGLRLYTYEKLSWMASDLLAEHATVDLSSIRGSAVQLDDKGKLTHFYCRQDSVVFSCTIDLNDFTLSWDNTVRPMTEDDRDAVHFRSEMINRIIETYGDSIYTIQDGSINIDLIWLGTDNLRDTQVLEVIHSHTVDNPFFTPTDICNALLYAHDLYGMKSVCVLSTVFVPSAIMTFNMDDMSITVDEWEPH